MQKKIFKSENGAVTLFVLIAILFFLIVIFGMYVRSSSKNQVQISEMEKESYRLITMSFLGTERAVLVFKKGLKGSLL